MQETSEFDVTKVDAAIIRLLKLYKTMKNQKILKQILEQYKDINLTPNNIESRLESLIEREYIIRDTNNQDVFHFLA